MYSSKVLTFKKVLNQSFIAHIARLIFLNLKLLHTNYYDGVPQCFAKGRAIRSQILAYAAGFPLLSLTQLSSLEIYPSYQTFFSRVTVFFINPKKTFLE